MKNINNFDFLNEYVLALLQNNKFKIADINTQISNDEFTKIVYGIANMLSTKLDRQLSVVILLNRNMYYIASMFATWFSNGYFIPLNPNWPQERIHAIIEHCDADIIITSKSLSWDKKNCKNILYVEDICYNMLDTTKLFLHNNPSNLAYIIYTSGSTGIPKGVMISISSYLSYIKWTSRYFKEFANNTNLLISAELTFDITMGDIAFALAFGSGIVVSPDPKNMITHIKLINKYKVDTLYSVPTTHNALFNFVNQKRGIDIDSVRLVISGGDSFSVELIKLIKFILPHSKFYNVYGPTEVTINCFAVRVDDKIDLIESTKMVPIGKPFDIIDSILIDDNGTNVTNQNKAGKLFVYGEQIMLGYLADNEKTENAFMLDPRYPKIKRKLYNTGDIAIQKDGLFYLLGRSDDIVKIKGYRINPTEINNTILKYAQIKESVVFAVEDKNTNKLVACVVVKLKLDILDFKTFFLNILPEYMLPSEIIVLDSLPLNNSGKIDKKLLKDRYKKGELR